MACGDFNVKKTEYAAALLDLVGTTAAFFAGKESSGFSVSAPLRPTDTINHKNIVVDAAVLWGVAFSFNLLIAGIASFQFSERHSACCNRYLAALLAMLPASGLAFGAGYTLNEGEAEFALLAIFSIFILIAHLSIAVASNPLNTGIGGYRQLPQGGGPGVDQARNSDVEQAVISNQGGPDARLRNS